MCIELNAHALITYALSIRDHCQGDLSNFMPWLLGSQTCEKTFRNVRSMSSTFSTVLNFSILGMLRRLHRLNIQLQLQSNSQDLIKFPSVERHRNKEGKNKLVMEGFNTVNDKDISEAIQRAKTKAKSTLEALGMDKLLKIHSIWDNESTTDDLLSQGCLPDDNGDDNDDDDDDNDNIDIDCNSEENLDDSLAVAIAQEVCLDTQDQLENDVQSAYSTGLITKEGKEKLHKIQKALPVERLPSDTIPMFSLKEHNSLASCLSTLNPKPSFTPFVEVTIKGRAVLIRKTTAVWLFQETERVSADRLFRVRLKQPFGSDLSVKNTLAVTIDQNSYDDRNVMASDTAMTPESTYAIDQNPNDKNSVVHDTAITLKSTSTINLNPDSDNGKSPSCKTMITNTDDDSDRHDDTGDCTQVSEICTREKCWLKIGCYVLNFAEKEAFCDHGKRKWLSDLHINAVQVLLKQQYPHIGGLQNVNPAKVQSPFQHLHMDLCRLWL